MKRCEDPGTVSQSSARVVLRIEVVALRQEGEWPVCGESLFCGLTYCIEGHDGGYSWTPLLSGIYMAYDLNQYDMCGAI
jgi:hypothetical protein